MNTKSTISAVILAAGKGKRMNMQESNKVTAQLLNKPIVNHIVSFMDDLELGAIIVVVGHAQSSVRDALKGYHVLFAEQTEQLGTGHALTSALSVVPSTITDLFVVYGDDGVFYTQKNKELMELLFEKHHQSKAAITFLTIEQDDPTGLGRIVRDNNDKVIAIIEEKDATEEQKKITEINPGCFLFNVDFVKKYLSKVEKSPVTGEYYLTSLIDIAFENNELVETVKGGKIAWRGVNTPEELEKAQEMMRSM
ncbi:MAG: UDP-N-acetylmuramoyl-L-alanyl-D-glutamate--2,6-diaminopimelate ligase [Patescibacteria group bacterium]|jgi:bifunctional UDP-N-acetylglucosamine pyrophosphorylase/glucosamine-1-phosphate N-acetyltransferase|nr:UDP-N-acetylmuramoyl-L-alanyl-D-glutamate--2,6-diaminopimelate ligase [Patescibacteria group bacterium]